MRYMETEMVEITYDMWMGGKDRTPVKTKDDQMNHRIMELIDKRSEQIQLLEAYSLFLEEHGYLDTDWRAEWPYAIDEFLKLQEPPKE